MRRIVWLTAVVLATLGLLVLLWQFRLAVLLFFLSVVTAAVVRPVVDLLVERGMRRTPALLLTYVVGVLLFVGLGYLVSGPFFSELQQATNNFADEYERITMLWPEGTSFQRAVAGQLPPPADLYQAIAGEQGALLLQAVLGVAQSFFGIISEFFIILVLSVYWAAERARFERLWLSVLPADKRTRARDIWRSIENGVSAYIRSELVQSLLAGILLGLGYWLIGLEYPVLLAISGALLWLIPWLGAVLAVILPLTAGLSGGLLPALAAAVYTFGILFIMEYRVQPRFFDRQRYSSLLIVLLLVAMVDAFGLLGLIIAPPLAAAIQILFNNLIRMSSPIETVQPGVQVNNLQTRLAKLREQAASMEQPPSQEVESLFQRMETLLAETGEVFQTDDRPPSLGLPASNDTTLETR